MVALARKTLIYEWRRFLPAILAVGFAGLLQLLQAALVLGIFSSASIYVTGSTADLWVGYPGTRSVSLGQPINPDVGMHLRMDPAVARIEPFYWVDGNWRGVHGSGGELVYVTGIDPRPDGLMFSRALPASLRARLVEPDTVIVDRADVGKLGVKVGDTAAINGRRVRVVGVSHGLRALGGVNVVTSIDTARQLTTDPASVDHPTYLLVHLHEGSQADAVARRLRGARGFGPYDVWTARQFARRSVLYWLLDTGAGAGVVFMAGIVFLVGAVITSQTLMAAVAGSAREYATLNALGVGLRNLRWVVLEQAFWVGALGLLGATMLGLLLLAGARSQDVPVALTAPITLVCMLLAMSLAAVSGLVAMRGLRRADPASLLR